MSLAGAKAQRRSAVEREFAAHAVEIAGKVAAQFQPVYERVCRERDEALERAAILQTAVELVALYDGDDINAPIGAALKALEQLGIVPDVQVAAPEE